MSSHVALKPLVKKQLSAWRPITARLNLLRQLISEFGLDGGSGLAADGIMSFVKVCWRVHAVNKRPCSALLKLFLFRLARDRIAPFFRIAPFY